jgi:hypothetical protein
MVWRSEQVAQILVYSDSPDEEGGLSMNRRTLYRALAAVVAIAAMSPLFASESVGCVRGSIQTRSIRQNLILQPAEFHLH